MRSMTALVAFLMIALLIACGPAAQTDQSNEMGSEVPISIGTSQQGDGPVDPTATPFPPTPELPIEPTATPKPPPSTKAPQPNDEEPTPTPGSGIPFLTPASPVLERPAEPEDGLSTCYRINFYNTTHEEFEYFGWCVEALVDDVVDNCSGTGDSAVELSCSRGRLANVVMYAIREWLVPCSAISDRGDHAACAERVGAAMAEHQRVLWQTWADILSAVEANPDVKVRKAAMAECVADQGYSRPDAGSPIPWHEYKPPDDPKTLRRESEAVRVATNARFEAIDECAVKVGLYFVQEIAWTNEIIRLQKEQPAMVKPLIDDGIVEALNADGIATFLMPERQRR